MGLIASALLGFIPAFMFAALIYWIDRFEKEPVKILVGVFLWGAVIAGGAAFLINTTLGIGFYLLTGSEQLTDLVSGSLVAPLVEEGLKGLAVLIVFIAARKEFDSLLDGIVYAGIAALGFAAVENTYYIYEYGWLEGGWRGIWWLAFVRVILVGWQHPFYTAFTGIGLALARLNRSVLVKLAAGVGGYLLAVLAHSLHNTLAYFLTGLGGLVLGSLVDWVQIFIMLGFIAWMVHHEGRRIATYLQEEVQQGLITPQQYRTACSAHKQSMARLQAIFQGRYRATKRFYQICAELAQKKYQWEKFGEEKGNAEAIAAYRLELQKLAQQLGATQKA